MMYFIFAAIIVLLDRLTKVWAASALGQGEVIRLIPGVLRLTYVENTGAAFSILSDMRWLLITVSAIATLILCAVIVLYRGGELGRLGASFILGGAVGNLIDRIMTGRVIDMLEPEFVKFAVFNVADVFITIGGIIFIIHIIFTSVKKPEPVRKTVQTHHATLEYDEDEPLTEDKILEEYYLERQLEADEDGQSDGE